MDRVTRLVNRLSYAIIIFQTETTSLQDLHTVWYVVLMCTTHFCAILCPKIEQIRILSNFDISDAKKKKLGK